VLNIAGGILSLIALIVVAIAFLVVFGIPAVIVGGVLYLLGVGFSSFSSLGLAALPLIAVAIIGLFVLMLVFGFVVTFATLPIHVFFRYYSLLFLDKIAPEYKVLEENTGGSNAPSVKKESKAEEEAEKKSVEVGGKPDKQEDQKDSKIFID